MVGAMTIADSQTDKYHILKETFGFDAFRPGQEAVVDAVLGGEDVLAVMPTGAGKSLCFQVPGLARGGLTIVVSPLVALMQDQVMALKLAGVAAGSINSAATRSDNVTTWQQAAAGEMRLLYMAPERLMTERMLAALSRLPVTLIAIDEAHCIAQWGPAFRPEYEALGELKTRFPGVPIAAFTATADEVTRKEIAQKLFANQGRTFVSGFDRPNIHLSVEMKDQWKRQLLDFLRRHEGESGIVYCLSRKKTEEAAAYLNENGFNALAYHAGMEASTRANNQNRFLSERAIVIVATIAFGMGIDKADVRFVFHTDIPASIEAYYQEIGRAGRDGRAAEAHMLFGLGDMRMRRVFIEDEDSDSERKRREHKRLDTLIAYCESPACRRRVLLTYFGENPEPCGNCDMCLNPVELSDGTAEAQLALATIQATGQRFGAVHIIDVMRGGQTEKIAQTGHDRLSVFGKGAAHSKREWQSIIRQIIASGFLQLDIGGFGGINLTQAGDALLRGEAEFHYRQDTIKAKGKAKTKSSKTAAIDLTDNELQLLDRLKQLRLELAQKRGVPAYVIFADRSLEDMARRQPHTRDEFAEIHGVGEAKLRDLAEPFLALINQEDAPPPHE
jgi:ATP-dependent DNA helicase RecQ